MEEMTLQEKETHKARSFVAIMVTILFLAGFGYFAYRVTHYVGLIQSGDLNAIRLSFSQAQTATATLENIGTPEGLFDVVTFDDPYLGNPDAEITIVEFADYGCPYCQEVSHTMRSLMQEYDDEVFYVYRDFPLSDLHTSSQRAAEAAACAHEQGKFWEYHDKLYQAYADWTDAQLISFAASVNLDTTAFTSCLQSGEYKDEVLEDYQEGIAAGVRGTPTFFINGYRVPGAVPKDVFEMILTNLLSDD